MGDCKSKRANKLSSSQRQAGGAPQADLSSSGWPQLLRLTSALSPPRSQPQSWSRRMHWLSPPAVKSLQSFKYFAITIGTYLTTRGSWDGSQAESAMVYIRSKFDNHLLPKSTSEWQSISAQDHTWICHGTVLYLSPQPPVYFCWSSHHICSAAPPCSPWLWGVHLLCTPFAPPTTGAAPLGFGGAPLLHPPAPSQVLDFGILPMYLSFQVHLWSSVLWMLEEYYYFIRANDLPQYLLFFNLYL